MAEGVGFVKIVADAKHNEIIGAHLIGPEVTELLPALTLAQQWDLTADEVARNVFAHPTLSEAMKEAVEGIAAVRISFPLFTTDSTVTPVRSSCRRRGPGQQDPPNVHAGARRSEAVKVADDRPRP
jgi:hypothetical protein